MADADTLVAWLRAAGEPTRLRLLAFCAQGEASVSKLALAVGQSEPRVSRHLKILCAAGLISRLRDRQWVHYRLGQDPGVARFLASLLAGLPPLDLPLARGAPAAPGGAREGSPARLRLDQALGVFIESTAGAERRASILVVGARHHEMLASAARLAAECLAVAHEPREARAARTFTRVKAPNCRVLLAAPEDGPIGCGVADGAARFDAIVLDRLTPDSASLSEALAAARVLLKSTGRLWLFERDAAFAAPVAGSGARALARLRQKLDEAGFACERLSPIQIDREHILAAVAVPALAVHTASVA
jgi:DNA-binding transcriptional ArsR family regulator